MSSLWQDLRWSFRSLRRRPLPSLAVVVVLGLGIGANTAVFSALDTILLRPLPVEGQERVVVLSKEDLTRDIPFLEISYAEFSDWREQAGGFSGLAAAPTSPYQVSLTGRGAPRGLSGMRVTEGYFSLLGVRPSEGRLFTPEDHRSSAEQAVILSDRLRRELFGTASQPIGEQLILDGTSARVVGVLPPEYRYPRGTDFWMPLAPTLPEAVLQNREVRFLTVLGRLAEGVSRQQAGTDLTALSERLAQEHQPLAATERVVVTPLVETILGDTDEALWLLYALVTLVLLIACVNVASLLLARAEGRRGEVALRSALGARRHEIVRQHLTETSVLTLAGAVLGVALAAVGVVLAARLAPPEVPRLAQLSVDGRLLVYSLAAAFVTALVAGLAPAVLTSRVELRSALEEASGTTRERGASSGLRTLVAVEVGIAVVLLVGAGLLLRSFRELQAIDPGFRAEGVLTARTLLSPARYPDPEQKRAFLDQVLERLRGLATVEEAAAVLTRPLGGRAGWSFPFTVEGQTQEEHEANPLANVETVTPGYFRALTIPRIAGRAFTHQDTADSAQVAIVSRSLAQRFWPGEPAVGRQVKTFGPEAQSPWRTVVGVVEDVRYRGLRSPSLDLYMPSAQHGLVPDYLVVRTTEDPIALLGAVERLVREVDPEQPVTEPATLEELVSSRLALPRLVASLSGVFALATTVLAMVGIYGLIAYLSARRRREIGLRMALGASRREILRRTLLYGLKSVASGLVLGVLGAAALLKLLAGLLYRTSAAEPTVWLGGPALLLAAATAAALVPALRAVRASPDHLVRDLDGSR